MMRMRLCATWMSAQSRQGGRESGQVEPTAAMLRPGDHFLSKPGCRSLHCTASRNDDHFVQARPMLLQHDLLSLAFSFRYCRNVLSTNRLPYASHALILGNTRRAFFNARRFTASPPRKHSHRDFATWEIASCTMLPAAAASRIPKLSLRLSD